MQVTAKTNIKHDGQMFTAGQTLEVSESQAEKLLAAGVINPVKGLSPEPVEEAPDSSLGTPNDKQAEAKGIAEVANLPVDKKMKKEKLIGIARAMGLEVDKTMTGPEVFDMIVEARGGKTGNEEAEAKAQADKEAKDEEERLAAEQKAQEEADAEAKAKEEAEAQEKSDAEAKAKADEAAKTSNKSK